MSPKRERAIFYIHWEKGDVFLEELKIIKAEEGYIESYRLVLSHVAAEKKYLGITEAFPPEETYRFMKNCIEKGYPCYFLLNQQNEVVGWCDICTRDEKKKEIGCIGIGLEKTYRGKGYGKKLLSYALIGAGLYGFTSLTLEVLETNQRAIQLYRSFGFTIVEKKKNALKLEEEMKNVLVMKLDFNSDFSIPLIRSAAEEDAETISKIYAASWKGAYQGIVPQTFLDQLKDTFWVAAFQEWLGHSTMQAQILFDKDIPIGCAAWGKAREERYDGWAEIVSFYLLPSYFGRGFARRLMDSVLEEIKKEGYHSVYLWVLKENGRAKRFYEKIGFRSGGKEITTTIDNEVLTDISYEFFI